MLDKNGDPAHWLGHPYRGKVLYEPINLVVVDAFSSTPDEAVRKLLVAAKKAGYAIEGGHSCGYHGLIEGALYPQIPTQKDAALSDGESFLTNNHGRFLGPARDHGRFIFLGGFSRESFTPFGSAHHLFVSFNAARDNFSRKLAAEGSYRVTGAVTSGNVVNTGADTTGDHDGRVVVLEAVR